MPEGGRDAAVGEWGRLHPRAHAREKMSRPRLSVPNGNCGLGGFNRCSRCEATMSPGRGAIQGAAIATKTAKSTIKSPIKAGMSRANFLRISIL
jgi:hypothetical protein